MGGIIGVLGGGLASVASQAACCCGSAACSLCCKSCPQTRNSTTTRIVYALMLLLSAISAWVMLDPHIGEQLERMSKYSGELPNCSGKECAQRWGQMGVFRVLWGSTIFFSVMAVVMIGVKTSRDARAAIQNGAWGIKLLVMIGLMVAAFFIKNEFFLGAWGWISLVGAFIFVLIQMVLLVDFAHSWADSWVGQMEEGSTCHKVGLLLASFVLNGGILAVTICMFVFYTHSKAHESCHLNKAFIGVNLALVIALTFVSVLPSVRENMPNSGILQTGVIGFYMTYLTWTAVSNTNGECQPNSAATNSNATTVIGAMLTFLSICYASLRTSSASQLGKLGMASADGMKPLLEEEKSSANDGGDDDDEDTGRQRVVDNEKEGVTYSWTFLHVTFAFASLFLTMVLTDWSQFKDGHIADIHVGKGQSSVWVAIVSSWLVALLYFWSLIAPMCCPNRDFN